MSMIFLAIHSEGSSPGPERIFHSLNAVFFLTFPFNFRNKMKQIYRYAFASLLGSSLLMVGCGGSNGNQKDDGPHGINYSLMDTATSPREDFFVFANGKYLETTEIPADQSRWGVFSQLGESTDKNVRTLIEEVAEKGGEAGSIDQKIADYYRAAMDTAAIEAAGIKPVQPMIDEIEALKSTADLAPLMAKYHRCGLGVGFSMWIDVDEKNSKAYIPSFYQGGMGLPEKDYYFKKDSATVRIREAYLVYLEKLLTISGQDASVAKKNAQGILAFETEMAGASMSMVDMRNPDNTYHKMAVTDFAKQNAGFPWPVYMEKVGLKSVDSINVATTSFFTAFSKMVASRSLDQWKTYMRAAVMRDMAVTLHKEAVMADFEFNDKTMGGAQEIKPRWKRVVSGMNYQLGMAIGQKYVEKHFSPKAKEIALEMVDNILETMKVRLGKLEWMSEATRKKAIQKVETILPKIGYPDKWRDYSGLTITKESVVKNFLAVNEFNFQYRLDKLGKPVDKTEWGMSPQIVNAYYNPTKNEIVFPAGILQPPFFDEKASSEFNYGGFGAVIGHELIHAFDDAGSMYDADGNLNMWWTAEDRANFEKRADLVRRQYDAYKVLDGLHVNGQLTLGENIADIFGLQMSYDAWKRSLAGKEAPGKENGYTAEQRFFIAYGQIWAGKMRDDYLRQMLQTDPHSPGMFRVHGSLSNYAAFYEAFGVKEGNGMWRPDSARADIW